MITRSQVFLLSGLIILLAQSSPSAGSPAAAESIRMLQSSNSLEEKAEACRELAVTGGRDAVPILSSLLADPKTSHMARYALERIPDPAVDDAFRNALDTLQGRQLAGVVTSIGVRHDQKAVQPLGKLLSHPDPEVADAAARALGQVGDGNASRLLLKAWQKQKSPGIAEGLLRCAETSNSGNRMKIYNTLLQAEAPPQVRAGALLEAVALNGKGGTKLLYRSLNDADPVLFSAALRVVPMVHGAKVTEELMEVSKKLGAERQLMVIQAVAKRSDPAGLPGLYGALKSDDQEIRTAAARAIGEIGRPSSSSPLLLAARDQHPGVAQAAFESLASLPGPGVEIAIDELLDSRTASDRKLGLDLASRRRMTSALPRVIVMAREDRQLGTVATRMIGELGGPAQVPVAVDLLLKARKDSEIQAAEEALGVLAGKSQDKEKLVAELVPRMQGVPREQKLALLRVVGGTEAPSALKVVRDAAGDRDEQVRMGAVGVLETWPGIEAGPHLLDIARNGTGNERALALRGYLRLAGNSDVPAAKRLEMCREASSLVQTDQEKRQLISAIGSMGSSEAVKLIEPWLDDATVKQEAEKALAKLKNAKP